MATTTTHYHHKPYNTISPANPANKQDGRTVLITGSTSGIGYAIATAFIQANASHVILTGRRQDRLDKAIADLRATSSKTMISGYIHDISIVSGVYKLWDALFADNINVDVLVLNAADTNLGDAIPLKPFITQLRSAMDTNVFTNLAMIDRFLEYEGLIPKTILNISSFMAHSNPAPNHVTYSTSKATFAHTLQLISDELSPMKCRMINIHPGAIYTRERPQEIKDSVDWDDAELPAAFAVWASTRDADFLHGKFVWANWDIDELKSRISEFTDPGYFRLGLQGVEHVNVATIFGKIRSMDRLRA